MSLLWRQKLACAYFFIAPALAYGIFTSRLPALKLLINANDGQMGGLLLALGGATLIGLIFSGLIIDRIGSKKTTAYAVILLGAAMCIASLAINIWQFAICCLIAGIGVGFCDVGMNALGIGIERKYNIMCMAFLHAVCGLGGVAGSLSGSLFAALGLSAFWNFLIVYGIYLLIWPWSFKNTIEGNMEPRNNSQGFNLKNIPFFVYACGVISLFCHLAEGSAGEWGSLLLHSKGASVQQAALVFAFFTGSMVICRFCTDIFRKFMSDFFIVSIGAAMGGAGMMVVLLASSPNICLLGYSGMGFGLAPVVPILFSRAGAVRNITPGQASAVISIFSYAGLLFFPPFIGMLAQVIGLNRALWTITGCCLIILCCSFILKKRKVS